MTDNSEELLRILRGEGPPVVIDAEARHHAKGGSIRGGYRAPMLPGQGYSNESKFGAHKETEENTLTWGATEALTLAGAETATTSVQLVHVHRKRPTTFSVAVMLALASNWTGEGPLALEVSYFIGVGQAKGRFVKLFTIATPTDGLAAVNDNQQLPATALQVQARLIASALVNPGPHTAELVVLAAPVFE
jgi:hypothetical protein